MDGFCFENLVFVCFCGYANLSFDEQSQPQLTLVVRACGLAHEIPERHVFEGCLLVATVVENESFGQVLTIEFHIGHAFTVGSADDIEAPRFLLGDFSERPFAIVADIKGRRAVVGMDFDSCHRISLYHSLIVGKALHDGESDFQRCLLNALLYQMADIF